MRVLFINNIGAGFADYVDLDKCLTIEEFFSKHMSGCDEMDYLIRINGQPVPRDYIIQNNDRITIISVEN